MTNSRVVNITRRYSMKYKQALRAIENHSAAWVEFGVSIRDLTLAESIALRNIEASQREPLAYAELPGITFNPPANQAEGNRREMMLAYEANKFFTETVQ